jgi:hypothetical protein
MTDNKRWLPVLCTVLLLAAGAVTAAQYGLGPSGGSGGEPFFDEAPGYSRIAEVRVWSGSHIDAVQLVYRDRRGYSDGYKYGGGGGRLQVFELRRGESIVAISGRYARLVNELQFHTNQGRSSPIYGRGGGAEFRYEAPRGMEISGLIGRSGGAIDAIGVVLRER